MPIKTADLLAPFRVTQGKGFDLKSIDPDGTAGLDLDKKDAEEALKSGVERLSDLQEKLYAQDRWSVLLIIQAMDAAGKDGLIKHVMSGVNPQGCEVTAFKVPSATELDHDFLWRCQEHLPERGRIGIFNRSYYEEVLVVRVHREILARQKLPPELVTDAIWEQRYEDIRAFERYLARNGTAILKFFLHVSKKEQKKRFLERIDDPAKNWKFSTADLGERSHWPDYMDAYQAMIRATASEEAPWYVVPADHKWFTRMVVSTAIIQRLESLKLAFPTVDAATRATLEEARKKLQTED